MKNIFFDFDGTLISNQKRLYSFFVANIDLAYKDVLTIDEFWNLKRLGVNEIYWLNSKYGTNLSIEDWNKKKSALIEEMTYLNHDILFDYTKDVLENLQTRYNLFLVTRRSNRGNLFSEIDHFNLRSYFQEIFVLPHGNLTKAEVLQKAIKDFRADDMFIGDTEDDLRSGLSLGVKTYFVLSGIRDEWILNKYFPDKKNDIVVLKSIKELVTLS